MSNTLDPVRCVRKTLVRSGDGGDQRKLSGYPSNNISKAVQKAVEDSRSSTTDWSKLTAKPNIFERKSQEEEIKAFREWSWIFEKRLSAVDEGYVKDQIACLIWTWQTMQRRPGASSFMDC